MYVHDVRAAVKLLVPAEVKVRGEPAVANGAEESDAENGNDGEPESLVGGGVHQAMGNAGMSSLWSSRFWVADGVANEIFGLEIDDWHAHRVRLHVSSVLANGKPNWTNCLKIPMNCRRSLTNCLCSNCC